MLRRKHYPFFYHFPVLWCEWLQTIFYITITACIHDLDRYVTLSHEDCCWKIKLLDVAYLLCRNFDEFCWPKQLTFSFLHSLLAKLLLMNCFLLHFKGIWIIKVSIIYSEVVCRSSLFMCYFCFSIFICSLCVHAGFFFFYAIEKYLMKIEEMIGLKKVI